MIDAKTQSTLRAQLEERKSEIEGSVSNMAEDIRALGIDQDDENGSLGNHLADDGSDVEAAERIVTISEDLQDLLAQINAALQRMDEGTYGTCLRCGRPIDEERLEAFPYVAYDIECQSRIEREQALHAAG